MKTRNETGQRDPAACACFNLRKTARVVTQVYDAHLRPTGLRATQFSLLATLAPRQPVGVTQLAEKLVMDRTTLTRNLRPLEKRGLIRMAAGADSRVHEISLTEEGRAALQAAIPYWENAQNSIAERLAEPRLDRLLTDLAAAREVFRPGYRHG